MMLRWAAGCGRTAGSRTWRPRCWPSWACPSPPRWKGSRCSPELGGLEGLGRLAQLLGLAGLLPEELALVAAEVAVGGGLAVDRPQEVQLADQRGRAAIE